MNTVNYHGVDYEVLPIGDRGSRQVIDSFEAMTHVLEDGRQTIDPILDKKLDNLLFVFGKNRMTFSWHGGSFTPLRIIEDDHSDNLRKEISAIKTMGYRYVRSRR